jgi:hypothetical protein
MQSKEEKKKRDHLYYINNKEKRDKQKKEHYLNNKEWYKNYSRTYDLKYRYGITEEQYDLMFNKQKGICPICKKPLNNDIHIDHDHLSKIVRGLLHGNCNRFLGFGNDNIEIFNNAIDYLKNNIGIIPKDYTEEFKENQRLGRGRGITGRKQIGN